MITSVRPSAAAKSELRPVGADEVVVQSGFWASLLTLNREKTIPHGYG